MPPQDVGEEAEFEVTLALGERSTPRFQIAQTTFNSTKPTRNENAPNYIKIIACIDRTWETNVDRNSLFVCMFF